MTRFIKGHSRSQATFLPEILDDYIAEDNSVRVVDVFADELDLGALGFELIPAHTGRPAFHPATMLKLFIYGYLNRVQSSRRLEREANRNVELMWLMGRLAPDFKTIADFRRNNSDGIKNVCRQFVEICRKLELFTDSMIAVDGSKFKASNNRDLNYTPAKIKYRRKLIEESIDKYLKQIESADRQDTATAKLKIDRLDKQIERLKKEIKQLNTAEEMMNQTKDRQLSVTDPDARSMKSRGNGIVGYNVQAAVDTKNHLIVAHEVTNTGSDRSQLSPMAKQAKAVLQVAELDVVTDRGYYNNQEIEACELDGMRVYLPRTQTSNNQSRGQYGKRDFIYNRDADEYECPAGQKAIYRFSGREKGQNIRYYWTSHCPHCSRKSACTTGVYRRVRRLENENLLDDVQERLDQSPEMMRIRRSTVEHPFGTIKSWMGYTHFQMRTLKHVSTEMSLHVLAYNLKRVMNIMGSRQLIAALMA